MSEQVVYSQADAAKAYGVSVDTLRRAIAAGDLRAKRLGDSDKGGKRLIHRDALDEWYEGLRDA